MLKNFVKLSEKENKEIYGGWGWMVAAVPLLMDATFMFISSYKMLSSDQGSLKYKGFDIKWNNGSSSSKRSNTPKNYFYSF